MSTLTINQGQVEVHEIHSDLTPGALKNARMKFSKAQQQVAIDAILKELEEGSLYLGDWRNGEIQITGIARILANRFYCEVEYAVLFPPKEKDGNPGAGTYRVIRWNSGVESGAAVLARCTDDRLVLTRIFRHASRRWKLEIPRGIRKPGESLHECGLREAREESGVSVTNRSEVFDLGDFDADSGILMARPRLLMVTEVEVDEDLASRDLTESTMGNVLLTPQQLSELLKAGQLSDGFTEAALLRAFVNGYLSL